VSAVAEGRPPKPYRSRGRLQHFTIQSAPLLLALIILVGMTLLWVVLFQQNLHKVPWNFEITTLVNNSMPLVFAAIG